MKRILKVEEFKELQEELGLTNGQIAGKLGVVKTTVDRWRMGLNPIPHWVRLRLECLLTHKKK